MLIVEDHAETRELYAWCLRASGWVVEEATNGDEAVLLARAFEPDAIVMDLHLPVLDGFEAIRHLRRVEGAVHVPIVACTGVDPFGAESRAREAGCDEFVSKPCEPEKLRDVLKRLLACAP